MTDPQVAVLMLGIFIFTILLGFPIAFTLVAMGVGFGYYAYYDPSRMQNLLDNRIFDLLVNQTYSVMANDVLTAVPLFLFMGYIVERANIVDRLFFSLQIAARRMPGSMAIAALATCALFATATGIVGAVVTLMGLLAYPAMLKARYDKSFSAGVICAGGCLGILIPPSIMLIVYAATSNVSVVKLYAGAILPGFMLAGLYIAYVIGRSILNPSLAPKPAADVTEGITQRQIYLMMLTSFFPLAFLILSVLGAILFGLATPSEAASVGALGGMVLAASYRLAAIRAGDVVPDWVAGYAKPAMNWLEALGTGVLVTVIAYLIIILLRLLSIPILDLPAMPRQLPGVPGLAVAVGLAAAAVYRYGGGGLPLLRRFFPTSTASRALMYWGGQGALSGLVLGVLYMVVVRLTPLAETWYEDGVNSWPADIGFFLGWAAFIAWRGTDWDRLRESVYLTVRTSAMVCWLFVGSWTFASVFSYLGGHDLIKEMVLSLNLSPITFLLLAQVIIFLLGWPLEWSEIIIIFVPIFLPMLGYFKVDPLFFGILVALNLQTSFLTPPMAMAAYYLKGVAPPHVQLIDIFKGVLPFLSMVFVAMILLYIFPGIALWLPSLIYGK